MFLLGPSSSLENETRHLSRFALSPFSGGKPSSSRASPPAFSCQSVRHKVGSFLEIHIKVKTREDRGVELVGR